MHVTDRQTDGRMVRQTDRITSLRLPRPRQHSCVAR